MKKSLTVLLTAAAVLVTTSASAAVSVRYYNKDSVDYTWTAVCGGSKKSVTFGKSRTASTTIQGSSPCVVETPNGKVTLKGGEKIEIKNARITIK